MEFRAYFRPVFQPGTRESMGCCYLYMKLVDCLNGKKWNK